MVARLVFICLSLVAAPMTAKSLADSQWAGRQEHFWFNFPERDHSFPFHLNDLWQSTRAASGGPQVAIALIADIHSP